GTQSTQHGTRNTSTQDLLVQASYEIDLFGRVRAAAASGKALAQASAFDADTVAMTLAANIANSYLQTLSLAERIRLAQGIADHSRQVLTLIEVRRAAGTATDLQAQQQRALMAGFEAAVPVLQFQRDQALHALAVLTGRPPEGFRVRAETLSDLARPAVAADLPASLLERRPDIRAAEARLISANFDIGVARAAFFPRLSLAALVGAGAKHLSNPFPPSAVTGFGVALLQPIFEGGLLEGQLRTNKARKLEFIATYRQNVLTALQETEDALSGIDRISRAEAIAAEAEQAAQKAADLANLQYRLGSADYLTVLTTEQTLYQAQDALLQLNLQHLQQIVSLFRAMGGGFDAPNGPQMAAAEGTQ
ncbi:MAG TPA: efflux transporter outer membrane subunit, partial [Acetobacteraceae bacterium]|nr:efflux transporter outer membrane subunit [Acetobacteraceae bacterium]